MKQLKRVLRGFRHVSYEICCYSVHLRFLFLFCTIIIVSNEGMGLMYIACYFPSLILFIAGGTPFLLLMWDCNPLYPLLLMLNWLRKCI